MKNEYFSSGTPQRLIVRENKMLDRIIENAKNIVILVIWSRNVDPIGNHINAAVPG